MRKLLLVSLIGSAGLAIAGHEAQPAQTNGENAKVSVIATAFTTPDQIKDVLGTDLGGGYIVLKVTVTPKAGTWRTDIDDFTLKTDKDGSRAGALAANQIAGDADVVLHLQQTTPKDAGGGGGNTMWTMGGLGMGAGSPGTQHATQVKTTTNDKKSNKETPLEAELRDLMLPEKDTTTAVSGLLVFSMDKQRPKDLELIYRTSDGELKLHFHK